MVASRVGYPRILTGTEAQRRPRIHLFGAGVPTIMEGDGAELGRPWQVLAGTYRAGPVPTNPAHLVNPVII